MTDEYVTMKLWDKTRRTLRKIAADTGESMLEVMDRLAAAEWQRLTAQNQPPSKLED